MTTEQTNETKSGKKRKGGKRICGFCHELGHNVRTCPKKKAAESSPSLPRPPSVPPVMGPGRVLVELEVESERQFPVEFEENSKQVHVNGTTLRFALRDQDGTSILSLRVQPQRGEPKDMVLDPEMATKLYELLGWGLQRHVARARAALPPRRNGIATTA